MDSVSCAKHVCAIKHKLEEKQEGLLQYSSSEDRSNWLGLEEGSYLIGISLIIIPDWSCYRK